MLSWAVERRVCENDRRAVDVLITPSGLDLLKNIEKHDKKWEKVLQTLSVSEAAQLNALLDKLRG